MKWSIKLGSLAGITIYMHATFLLLIAWIAIGSWSESESAAAVAADILFIFALFGCIVLHELGHALTARRFAIQTRDITLLPIGGIARLERMPKEPRQELLVALAGPAVNLVIAAAIAAWLVLVGSAEASWPVLDALEGPFLDRLLVVNLFLLGFNLLPAFPMDGGRALRAVLALRMDYVAATQSAASVGQAMALGFALIGLLANPFLIFIALFVWIGAAAEASMVQMEAALAGIPVARAMLKQFEVLATGDPLDRAVELTLRGSQKDFPVLENGVPVGILSQGRMLEGLQRSGGRALVGAICEREFSTADSHEMLDGALERLQQSGASIAPVTHEGRVVGLLTLDNVSELVRIKAALMPRREGAARS